MGSLLPLWPNIESVIMAGHAIMAAHHLILQCGRVESSVNLIYHSLGSLGVLDMLS